MIQEYLPGQNIAWDSFWYDGKLIASYTRERIEYPFKHISPSGITGTPTVSKICLLYTSDAADEEDSVDLGGRRIIKKKKKK